MQRVCCLAPNNTLVALGALYWRDWMKDGLLARLRRDGGDHRNVARCDGVECAE